MNTTEIARRMHTCQHCGEKFTVFAGKGGVKRARDIHEAKHCPSYWEQGDAPEA